jgi:hypothetical protein
MLFEVAVSSEKTTLMSAIISVRYDNLDEI